VNAIRRQPLRLAPSRPRCQADSGDNGRMRRGCASIERRQQLLNLRTGEIRKRALLELDRPQPGERAIVVNDPQGLCRAASQDRGQGGRDKIRVALRQIFSQAIARGLCENNPASELVTIATKTPPAKHYPHLLEPELPAFLRALRMSTSRTPARTATWLCLWTASRPGMVRFAEWVEIDFDNALWTIPAEKMKTRRDHVVPLSRQALEALHELHRITGRGRYLFPGIGAKQPVISENTINLTLRKIGYRNRLVGHGTRHTASTLLREHGWEKDHVEAQLAHKEAGVSGIYNRRSTCPSAAA